MSKNCAPRSFDGMAARTSKCTPCGRRFRADKSDAWFVVGCTSHCQCVDCIDAAYNAATGKHTCADCSVASSQIERVYTPWDERVLLWLLGTPAGVLATRVFACVLCAACVGGLFALSVSVIGVWWSLLWPAVLAAPFAAGVCHGLIAMAYA